MFPTRIAIVLWLVFISAMLVGFDRGEIWLLLLVPAIVTHGFIAYKIRPGTRRRHPPHRPVQRPRAFVERPSERRTV